MTLTDPGKPSADMVQRNKIKSTRELGTYEKAALDLEAYKRRGSIVHFRGRS